MRPAEACHYVVGFRGGSRLRDHSSLAFGPLVSPISAAPTARQRAFSPACFERVRRIGDPPGSRFSSPNFPTAGQPDQPAGPRPSTGSSCSWPRRVQRGAAPAFGPVLTCLAHATRCEPLRKQIDDGSPVSFTHPEATRYLYRSGAVHLVITGRRDRRQPRISPSSSGEPAKSAGVVRRMVDAYGKNTESIFTGLLEAGRCTRRSLATAMCWS